MLIHLISDYLRDPKVRERFAAKPEEVFSEYEVTPAQQQSLGRGELTGLGEKLKVELERLQAHPIALGRLMPNGWGTPNIDVKEFSPSTVTVGVKTPITVEGFGFPTKEDTELWFVGTTGGSIVQGEVEDVRTQPDGSSVLTGSVTFDASQVGAYQVVVSNTRDGAYGASPRLLEVVEPAS